jgi:thiol-disulfide isomerase/thioredoxin
MVLACIYCIDVKAQQVSERRFSAIDSVMHVKNDTLYVMNFWATWCKPCVKELPAFEEANRKFNGRAFRMILVSLDFANGIETRIRPFLKERDMKTEVWVLKESDYSTWIDKVNEKWSGSLPATLIFNNGKKTRRFHEGEISEGKLNDIISGFLK